MDIELFNVTIYNKGRRSKDTEVGRSLVLKVIYS